MNITYAAIITTNSPTPTQRTLYQNGEPNKYNSPPTTKALHTTGKIAATAKCLENIIPTHATNVAALPKGISKEAVGEYKLASKQPKVNPIVYFLLKKHKRTNISEKRNCIGP